MVPHVEKRVLQIWINSGSWDGEMVLDHLGGPSVIPGSLGARAWCQEGSSRLLPQQWAIKEVISSQEAASWPFGTFMKTRNEWLLTFLDHQQLVLFILTYVASYFFSEAIMLSDFGNGFSELHLTHNPSQLGYPFGGLTRPRPLSSFPACALSPIFSLFHISKQLHFPYWF